MEHNTHIKSLSGHGVRTYRRSAATTAPNSTAINAGNIRATTMSASKAGTSGTGGSSSSSAAASRRPAVGGGNAPRRAADGGGIAPRRAADDGGIAPRRAADGGGIAPRSAADDGGIAPRRAADGGSIAPRRAADGGGIAPRRAADGGGIAPRRDADGARGGGNNAPAAAARPRLGPIARFKASAFFRVTASISQSIERRFRSLMNRHRDSYRPAAAAGAFSQTEGIGGMAGIDITLPIRRTGISLIMNGSVCPAGEHGVQPYFVKNSCPFDSVIVAIANAYMDYEQYAEFVDHSENEFLHLAKELGMFGPSEEVYDKRVELLLPFFKFVVDTYYSTPPTLRTLDVECNVWKIVQDYLKRDPSSVVMKTCSNEEGCPGGLERIRYSASVVLSDGDLSQIRELGFSCLQTLMEAYIKPSTSDCMKYGCDGDVETKRLLGRHVFVETDSLSVPSKKFKCPLSQIPPYMILAGDNYVLQSVIHFTSFHYMTYVRRPLGHWEMHNDMHAEIKNIKKLEKIIVCPHAIVYIKL